MRRLIPLLLLVVSVDACSPSSPVAEEPYERDPQGPTVDLGSPGPCHADRECPAGMRCYERACIPDHGTCCQDDDCQNDTRCSAQRTREGGMCGVCIPYKPGEFDPMCQGQGFSAMEFRPPMDRCKWPPAGMTPPAREVVMTPLVIDLDGDGKPEIVFAPQQGSSPARLVAIRGHNCAPLYDVDAGLQAFAQLAAGDLDGDRRPEIVGLLAGGAQGGGRRVAVFAGQTGQKLAESATAYEINGAGFDCSGPAIADLDGDGTPEIVVAATVLRWNKPMGRLDVLWSRPTPAGTWGTLSLANDMDGDGKLEVVTGTRIYDGLSGADKTPSVMNALTIGGYPAIGDFNKDGHPDLVFVQSQNGNQRVAVVDVKNNAFLMNPTPIPGGWGGPPTVADFDGDGKPEFGTAGPSHYYVFSLDCLANPPPAKCRGSLPGVLWQSQTKDRSSGGTASSVFDFNGDGRPEVVYRDECWLRVYDGRDGRTLFARSVTSGTALEMPVVADVDNDGHADLVVPSDSIQGPGYCHDQTPEPGTGLMHTGPTQGVFVLRDPMNRWMPSRAMWNQHTYHITNINDDGTLPRRERENWLIFNNYRQNVQGLSTMPVPQGDLTGRGIQPVERGDCVKVEKLHVQMCNRGSATVAAGVPGTFYAMDPRMGASMPICTARTRQPLAPGQCEVVSCDWLNPPRGSKDLWFRANDDGMGGRPEGQCKNKNDLAFLPGVTCTMTPG
ncbi:MAG: VCBS repeat-containing protein [Myxococcales bacterium]|nr:VCBS repeat-containing protein [Myxococcota bacterium]MDW8280582.1 VCBS repeat-containing protein [Myxococcales bacterium]